MTLVERVNNLESSLQQLGQVFQVEQKRHCEWEGEMMNRLTRLEEQVFANEAKAVPDFSRNECVPMQQAPLQPMGIPSQWGR